jgi:hypothetical protein
MAFQPHNGVSNGVWGQALAGVSSRSLERPSNVRPRYQSQNPQLNGRLTDLQLRNLVTRDRQNKVTDGNSLCSRASKRCSRPH